MPLTHIVWGSTNDGVPNIEDEIGNHYNQKDWHMSLHDGLVAKEEFNRKSKDWDNVIHHKVSLNFPVNAEYVCLFLKDCPIDYGDYNFQSKGHLKKDCEQFPSLKWTVLIAFEQNCCVIWRRVTGKESCHKSHIGKPEPPFLHVFDSVSKSSML